MTDINKSENQSIVMGSELTFNDVENILWAICYAEVIARDREDNDLIGRVKNAQISLRKVRDKLCLSGDPFKFSNK